MGEVERGDEGEGLDVEYSSRSMEKRLLTITFTGGAVTKFLLLRLLYFFYPLSGKSQDSPEKGQEHLRWRVVWKPHLHMIWFRLLLGRADP